MKVKYLTVTLIAMVTIFVVKGYYVGADIAASTEKSYAQFEAFNDTIHPLMDSYSNDVVESVVKAGHKQTPLKQLCIILENGIAQRKVLLNDYLILLGGNENADDKELFIRGNDVRKFVEELMVMCKNNDFEGVHNTVQSGELFRVFNPMQECLHQIGHNQIMAAAEYKEDVRNTIDNFNRVITYAAVLVVVLLIFAIQYNDPIKKDKGKKKVAKKSRKKNLKTRTAIKKFER